MAAFWSAVTGYAVKTERDDFAYIESTDKRGVRRLLFYAVPETKVAKNRMHVDLATAEPATEVTRLIALGATVVEARSGEGTHWTVMLDPEGNEFCVG
jgi:hypothetical protein